MCLSRSGQSELNTKLKDTRWSFLTVRPYWCNNTFWLIIDNYATLQLQVHLFVRLNNMLMRLAPSSITPDHSLHAAQVEFLWSSLESLRFLVAGIRFLKVLCCYPWLFRFPWILWTSPRFSKCSRCYFGFQQQWNHHDKSVELSAPHYTTWLKE